jgi:hypothetical protein
MIRISLSLFLGISSIASAQEPKAKPPAKARIAIADTEKLKDDKDFAIQGEYAGKTGASNKDQKESGIQLIARGNGKFEMKFYEGGLPGDGWDGKLPVSILAKRGEHEGEPTLQIQQDGKWSDFFKLVGGTKLSTLVSSHEKVHRKSKSLGAKPPEGAVVLFGEAGDESKWTGGKLVELSDGKFLGNGIKSKQAFGSFTAHIEFRLPWMPNSRGQARGNSGVYLQDRYEVQVLDSFGLKGLNNECGGIYTQHAPKVNMCYPPLAWQTYDIDFTAATFDADGKRTKPARATIKHNGVVIHDNVEFKGPTGGGQPEKPTPGPFQLQNHGDPVVYRNIWVLVK